MSVYLKVKYVYKTCQMKSIIRTKDLLETNYITIYNIIEKMFVC